MDFGDLTWTDAIKGGASLLSNVAGGFLNDYFARGARSDSSRMAYEMAAYNAALSYKYARLNAEDNYSLARRYAINSPSWNMQGLRDAGLNPLLAFSNGTSGAMNLAVPSTNTGSVPSMASGSTNGDLLSGLQALSSLNLNKSSAAAARSQADVNAATADRIRQLTEEEVKKARLENEELKSRVDVLDSTHGQTSIMQSAYADLRDNFRKLFDFVFAPFGDHASYNLTPRDSSATPRVSPLGLNPIIPVIDLNHGNRSPSQSLIRNSARSIDDANRDFDRRHNKINERYMRQGLHSFH